MREPVRHKVEHGSLRSTFLSYDEVVANRADAMLLVELNDMLPGTTEDLEDPWEKAAR